MPANRSRELGRFDAIHRAACSSIISGAAVGSELQQSPRRLGPIGERRTEPRRELARGDPHVARRARRQHAVHAA